MLFLQNYLGQEGNVVTSNFDRVTTRLSIDSQVTDWFKAGITSFIQLRAKISLHKVVLVFKVPFNGFTQFHLFILCTERENGDLVTDGNGGNIFDYGATPGQLLNASRPTLSNENAFGSLYNYK
jgi:hypothetical protein